MVRGPGDGAVGGQLGVYQLEGVLHGVVEARQEVPQALQAGVKVLVVRVLRLRVLQELLHQEDVPGDALHGRQQEGAQVQAAAGRLLQTGLQEAFG